MKEKKLKKILYVILYLSISLFLVITFRKYSYGFLEEIASKVSNTFELNLTPLAEENENSGAIKLDWNLESEESIIYKAYQSRENGAENSWNSISLMDDTAVSDVKVLEIYSDTNSGQLEQWMEQYGKDKITVSKVNITEFNTNPTQYLKKDETGSWNCDVLFFSDAGTTENYDLTTTSKEEVDKFIGEGYGCIFGHNTILNSSNYLTDDEVQEQEMSEKKQTNFDAIAAKYFKSLALGSTQKDQPTYGGTELQIVKKGLLTTYPWKIGEIGKKLTVPERHTGGQIINQGYENNVWFRFSNYPLDANYNYYLVTENNVSMIQTEHSNEGPSEEEQKVIANLIFSSYQISSNNSVIDRSAMDYNAPTVPTIDVNINDGNVDIDFSSQEEGTNYTYKVEAYNKLDYGEPIAISNTQTETVTSGMDKYYYVIDEQEENDFDINDETNNTQEGNLQGAYQQYHGKYIHIKAIDKAGNISGVKTAKIIDDIAPEVVVTPKNCEWKQKENISLQFSDEGGSNFKEYKYIINDSEEPASEEEWDTAIQKEGIQGTIELTDEGIKYIHVKGFDNANNSTDEAICGPYNIDHTNPTAEIYGQLLNKTIDPVQLTITAYDETSDIKNIYVNETILEDNTYTIEKNGTYVIKVEDNAGNIYEKSIEVTNIYVQCEAELSHPDYSSSLDSCPICELIKNINVTKEEIEYNAKPQGIEYENNSQKEIVEYYNGEQQKPTDVGQYQYELKIKSDEEEYLTGKSGNFNIKPKKISLDAIEVIDREYDGTTNVNLIAGNLIGVENIDKESVNTMMPNGTIENKNAGTHDVIVPEILLMGDRADNYELIQPSEKIKVNISKRQTQIEGITANNRIYNATTQVELNKGNLTRIIEQDIENIDYTWSGIGTLENKNVGRHSVIFPQASLTGSEADNYELSQPTEEVIVEIEPKDVHIANIESTNKEYDGTTTVTLSDGTLEGVEPADSENVGYSLQGVGIADGKNVGVHNTTVPEISLTGSESGNYNLIQPRPEDIKVTITKRKTQVEGITATNREYNGTTEVQLNRGSLTRVAVGDEGKVDYTLAPTGTINSKNIGTYSVTVPDITLTGLESENYEIVQLDEGAVSVQITPKHIDITNIKAENREYDGTMNVSLSGGELTGVESGDTSNLSFELPKTGTIENKNVNTYNVTIPEIKLMGKEVDNYYLNQPELGDVQVTIQARQTKVEGITATNRQYNATTDVQLNRGKLTRIVPGEENKVDYDMSETGKILNKDVGQYDVSIPNIRLTGSEAGNYALTQPTEDEVQVQISKKDINIISIKAQNKEYDGTTVVNLSEGALTGVESIDIQALGFDLPATGTTSSKNVGDYDVTVPNITLNGDAQKNYNLIQPTLGEVRVNISKRQTKVEGISATNRQYNATTEVQLNRGSLSRIISEDSGKVDYTMSPTGTISNKDVGNYYVTIPEIVLTGAESGNYELTQPGAEEVQVEISKKDINITKIKAEDREYDGTTTINLSAGELTGVEGIDVSILGFDLPLTGTVDNKNVGIYSVHVPDVTLNGNATKNYNLIQPELGDVKVTISKRQTRIDGITATNRQYNATKMVQINRGVLTRIVSGEESKVNYEMSETGTIPSKDIGSYKVTIPNITLTGEESGNYNLTQPGKEEVGVEITRKDINITRIKAADREYDGTVNVELSGGELTGVENADKSNLNFVLQPTGTIPNKNVGDYDVTIPEITLEGKEANNYHLIQPTLGEVRVKISKRMTKVSGITATNKEYDGTTTVEVNRGNLIRIVPGEERKVDYTLATTGTISSKDAGVHIVSIPDIVLTGDEADNYNLIQPGADEIKVEIAKRKTQVEGITADNRIYNATDVVQINRGILTRILDEDAQEIDYEMSETGKTPTKDVGKHFVAIPEIKLTGEEAKNYELIQPGEEEVSVEITQKDIHLIEVKAEDREYDGTTEVDLEEGHLSGVEEPDLGNVEIDAHKIGVIPEKDVGTYSVLVPEILNLTGSEAHNYNLIQPTIGDISVNITKRKVTTENVKGKTRKYDKTDVVEMEKGNLVNVVEGEDVSLVVPETGIAENTHTGTWVVKIDELQLAGEDIANYELVQPNPEDITVEIVRADQPDLHVIPYISSINGEELEETIPVASLKNSNKSESPQVTYKREKLKESIRYADNFTITLRIYNEGIGAGYAQKITNVIPEELEFVKDDETNEKYNWEKGKNNTVTTDYLNFESGEENEIIAPEENEVDYRDVLLTLKVSEKERLDDELLDKTTIEEVDIENEPTEKTQTKKNSSSQKNLGDEYGDKTYEEGVLPIKISYTDFQLDVAIKGITKIENGVPVSVANQSDNELGKVEVKRNYVNSTRIQMDLGITIKNVGNASGTVEKLYAIVPSTISSKSNDWSREGTKSLKYDKEIQDIEAGKSTTVDLSLEGIASEIMGTNDISIVLISEDDINQRLTEEKESIEISSISDVEKIKATNNFGKTSLIASVVTGPEKYIVPIIMLVLVFTALAVVIDRKRKH